MVEIPILEWDGDAGAAVVEESGRLGLAVSSDGRLSKYPGSRHWHLIFEGRPGTLEVTFWPQKHRLWVTYHANRIVDGWVEEYAVLLSAALAVRLNK